MGASGSASQRIALWTRARRRITKGFHLFGRASTERASTGRLFVRSAGVFSTFNHNKKNIAVDVKDLRGVENMQKLFSGTDIFSENFKSGTMDKLGLAYAALSRLKP